MRRWLAFALAWALVLGGGLLASRVQTSGGTVAVSEVRIPAADGVTVSGLLYRPAGATAQAPAPAALISHGYINTREMQSPFAIELSRRGYVVLAMDMTGHGYSGGIVGTEGFGGPAALRWLQAQPFVDRTRIGLEGHSMGGGPIMAAAVEQPDGYRAVVLEGSTPGLLRAKAPENPRNLALVFGEYEEFAGLMWQVPTGDKVGESKRLQKLFGTAQTVQPGRLYGDIAAGTARQLYLTPTTHPGEHFSASGVGAAVDWLQRTVPTATPKPASDQVWIWKDIGTLISFLGVVWLILATFDLLLTLPVLAALARPAEPVAERRGGKWWAAFALSAALPALTYFPLMKLGNLFRPFSAFPQSIHNQLLVWALGTALISLVIGLVLKPGRAAFTNRWIGSAALAAATMAVAYLAIVICDLAFKTDFRFWVVGMKPLSAERAVIALPYLALWTVFFLLTIRGLVLNLSIRGEGLIAQLFWAKLAMALGFFVLVAWQYGTMLATHRLATPSEPLNVIVAIQFVPLLAIMGAFGAWTYRRTNSYVPGALICALFISWYVTSGTANHWRPGFEPPAPPAAASRR